ncbi:MAG: 50S ribosomal protein L10 [Legionellales bacterium RIFCSPHIGHO2_12_FULL_37_14]|nr:MAG: 50S ribosomal protein L10 [Legionellales bacterium RIFCSPHIGHO2_12_FULL_37_14]
MTLTLDEKKVVVEEVANVASKALSAVVADYRGLTVNQMTQLRAAARKNKVYMRIVRNTLTKRAFASTPYSNLSDKLVGPVIIALSLDSPGDAARLFKEYTKTFETLEVKALSLSGQIYDGSQLNAIASLPTRDEALAKLMYMMKAPVEKLVRTMAEPHAKLTRLLAQVKDTKQ